MDVGVINQPSKWVVLLVKLVGFGGFLACDYSTEWHKHWGLANLGANISWSRSHFSHSNSGDDYCQAR